MKSERGSDEYCLLQFAIAFCVWAHRSATDIKLWAGQIDGCDLI